MGKSTVLGIFRFVSLFFFLIFENGISKKIVRGIFIFGSMLFINIGKGYQQKNRPG